MSETWISVSQTTASLLSIALMGAAGVQLLFRLISVIRGEETADGRLEGERFGFDGRGMLLAAGAALVSRVLVAALAYGMLLMTGTQEGPIESLYRLWLHWDTHHYIGIAQEGYTAVGDERLRLVFFPLFPLLMRGFSVFTGGNVFYGGLLVSLLCSLVCGALVYDLGMMHGGRKTAALSVAYFLLSPMSVFLNCAYTEALFIMLTLGVLCLLRRGHPWLAALCGAASALTRMPGVVCAGFFIIACIGRCAKERVRARTLLACAAQVLIVFSGLFIYWGINWAVTGDAFMYLTYQKENWFQTAGSFWETASTTVYYMIKSVGEEDWFFCWVTQLAAMFFIYALLAAGQKRLPFDLEAYSFVYIAVIFAPSWLLSGPRYLYALCALPLLKAKVIKSDMAHGVLLGLSASLLALYTYGFTLAVAVL